MACGLIGDKLTGLSVLAAVPGAVGTFEKVLEQRTKEIELQLKLRLTERTTSESLQGEFNVVLVGNSNMEIFSKNLKAMGVKINYDKLKAANSYKIKK